MDDDFQQSDFQQIDFDDRLREDWRQLLELAVCEDLANGRDLTTDGLVPGEATGRAEIIAREAGVAAGLPLVEMTLGRIEPRLKWRATLQDGRVLRPADCLGSREGPAGAILKAERIVLNMLGRLCGIAGLTRRYVEAVSATTARIYDTRKTTPGWRRLEKYAVRQGGGCNHRTGLFDAVLIKDNHLALGREFSAARSYTPAEAVVRARDFIAAELSPSEAANTIIEIEVDTLQQFDEVLPAGPHIVLLDNMSEAELREAVSRRDKLKAAVELEASGGVTLETVAAIARTGVERISVGALTHSAASLDLGLDWQVSR